MLHAIKLTIAYSTIQLFVFFFFLLEFAEDGGIEGWIDDGTPQAGVIIHLDARNMMMMAIFFLQMTSQYIEEIIIFFVDFFQNSWNSCVLFQN